MAGQRPVKTIDSPDIASQIITIPIMASGGTISQYVPVFQAEKDTIVEDARIRVGTRDDGVGTTAVLVQAPSGTALSSGTAITSAVAVDTGSGTANTSLDMPLLTTNSLSTQIPTQNLVPGDTTSSRNGAVTKGSTLAVKFSAAPGALDGVVVTLRITQKKQ